MNFVQNVAQSNVKKNGKNKVDKLDYLFVWLLFMNKFGIMYVCVGYFIIYNIYTSKSGDK